MFDRKSQKSREAFVATTDAEIVHSPVCKTPNPWQCISMVQITYYLEVVSSWCFWSEPAWAELKDRYKGRVNFDWKIALMPAGAFPVSKNQCEWFYRRSGSIMGSPFMLNSGWFEPDLRPYLAANYIAQAARNMGVTDDRARLALSRAALREGQKVGRWEIAAAAVAHATGLYEAELVRQAQSPEVAALTQRTTAEFHALQVTQRPAFLIENSIGDRAVFSGVARDAPLMGAIDALLSDEAAYMSWNAHFGDPPKE
jgi:predicted DsbA family dithiol-disulfide isomerase